MEKLKTIEYQLGWQSAKSGLKPADCPYDDKESKSEWLRGYNSAKQK